MTEETGKTYRASWRERLSKPSRATRCPKPDCPGHRSPAGGCPDPVGHLLRCEFCNHIPLRITAVNAYELTPPEQLLHVSCEACGAQTELPQGSFHWFWEVASAPWFDKRWLSA